MDFPLIYCNGDSYSNDKYHPDLENQSYANCIGETLNGFVMNKSLNGSCNRRIIRTTVHDMIQQRELNPAQKIIALIGLSFELRSELWDDELLKAQQPEESNFQTHVFSSQLDWRERLLSNKPITDRTKHKFCQQYSEGRAFFFSPYAERINLLSDLLMLKYLFDKLNINFLVFQSPQAEKLQSEYLLDFFKERVFSDPRFIDFESFGFVDWCCGQGFVPLDYKDRPSIGHYGPEAHREFADKILLPKLKETGQV